MDRKLSPIVIFVYNRPNHIKKTIEALKNNDLSSESELFIFSDGPKNEDDYFKVNEVRDYIHTVDGFKSIEIIERENNIGLGKNVIDGITQVINRFGRIIVLEDDIITSPFFLEYMNDALDKYLDEEKVMSISGYTPPMDIESIKEETFFMSWPDCWGWGTWKRAWDKFERNPQKLISEADTKLINKINVDGSAPFMWSQVKDNSKNIRYTWAIFFHAVICQNEGLTLYCRESLTSNEGMDGSGDDSGVSSQYDVVNFRKKKVCIFTDNIEKNIIAEKSLKQFYRKVRSNNIFIVRVFNVIKNEGLSGIKKRLIRYKI